jgi:hypothetical protein
MMPLRIPRSLITQVAFSFQKNSLSQIPGKDQTEKEEILKVGVF